MATSDAVVSMDRFVSASSAQDAISSLEKLVNAFKSNGSNHDNKEEEMIVWDPAWIFEHEEIAEHLIWLLQHGTLKANEIPCEEGVNLVCQLYKYLIKTPEALKKPSPGLLLESLLDVLDNSENPIYVRVLALQVLEDLSKRHKSIAVNQWLQAPNGLHRIADLLAIDVDNNPMEEAIRNQALIVAKSLAREAPIARVFLFAEVECKLLDLCWKKGGLTKGNPIVIDALELIEEILKHTDASLQDLMWQRPNVAPRLCMLLDLRGGDEFLHPTQKSLKATQEGKGGDDDDLDSLLASGDTIPKEDGKLSVEEFQIPRLLPAEENVIKLVLNILRLLLETDSVRHVVWKQHNGLCNMVWDLALVNNPMNPPVCALPSSSLQQEALNVVADKFNDPITMDHLSGLDRLLSLVCTGGGISDKFDDKLGLSQSALAVLRQSLSGDRIHDILMRTLAPPPTEDENAPPPGPTVVQKLWNTVQENLSSEVSEQRTIFLSGALGGLGLMLRDEQSREIMSKVAPIGLDQLLESLSEESDGFVQCSLVRFFCEWIYECPFIAHNILCSTASTHLAGMAAATSSYQSLTHLLLGLAMEYLTKEEECGGWTRNGILQIIIQIGISKYTLSLEGLKKTTNLKMPWIVSEMEYKNWKRFCSQSVLTVRKRVVEELAGGSGEADDESDGDHNDIVSGSDGTSSLSNHKIKPLQKLISQQSKEMDEMRKEIDEMRARLISQDDQLNTWKRRMESTPTELDDLLNEFTSKNIKLEETMRTLESEVERQKSEKETDTKLLEDKLSESRGDADRLRTQEQEVRDDLQRTEQEMQALSQAYASLEEEYQRNQNHQNASAPAGETSQQIQGEVSHQQSGIGSTEVATLRAENTRLKNDARAADEWMSMAVQKLNDMGGANVDLEKQVASLNTQIVESQAVAENDSINSQNGVNQLEILESELKEEKALRVAADERASSSDNLKIELEREQQNSETLARRITEAQVALSKYENMGMQMQSEQKRYAELENRIFEAEEEIRVTTSCLEDERNAKFEIEKQLSAANLSNSPSNDGPTPTQGPNNFKQLELLRSDYDEMATTKDAEIEALTLSLQKSQRDEQTFDGDTDTKDIGNTKQEINESRERSQEEIYRLESVIRELNDRLGSGLGAYKVEDIRARDEEIEELRTANEAAQEWMNKAVEHHQRNSTQISNLSEEKVALTLKLEEERMKVSSQKMNDPSSIQNELVEKNQELDLMNENLARIEVELEELKNEKEANQGLLDELGIAMDDVKIMQQQLVEYKAIVTDLETKLSGNRLNEENDELRSSNKDLQTKLNEFEEWTQAAQSKIADIMGAKDKAEIQLLETTEELRSLQKENESLHTNLAQSQDDKCALEKLKEDVAMLESTNDSLPDEVNDRESQYADLQSQYNILLQKSHDSEQKSNCILAIRDDLEKDLMEERQLLIVRCAEIDNLKAENMALLGSLEKSKNGLDENQATPTESLIADSIDFVKEQNDKTSNVNEEVQVTRINELLEELDRTNVELTTANEALSRDEDVVREWEGECVRREFKYCSSDILSANFCVLCACACDLDRVSQLESELANALLQMQEQEKEALDAIAKWQLNSTESEEKCAELEEKLKKALDSKESIDATNNTPESEFLQLKEDNISLQEQIKELEISLAEKSDHDFDSETQDKATVIELQDALKIAQETLTRDEEVVQQWEGKSKYDTETYIDHKRESMRLPLISLKSLFPILERVTELETNIKSLQTELREQEDEANDVISQWQDNCAAAELKYSTIEEELEELKKSKHSDVSIGDTSVPVDQTLVDTLAKMEDELRKAHEDAESNKDSMQELKGMLCRIINPHVCHSLVFFDLMSYYFSNSIFPSFFSLDQVSSLESRIKELQNKVPDEEAEKNDANLELKESLDLSEKKCFQLQKDIEEAVATKEEELQQLRELLSNNRKSQEQNEGKSVVHKFTMIDVYAIEFSNSYIFPPTQTGYKNCHTKLNQ
jgi:chromosome segregation ATPase